MADIDQDPDKDGAPVITAQTQLPALQAALEALEDVPPWPDEEDKTGTGAAPSSWAPFRQNRYR
jgi:hypothetical protein